MPYKIQPDDNLLFLFRCLEASDYKNIDFHPIGAVGGLKAPAARMRFTRLRKNIKSSTSISNVSALPTNDIAEATSSTNPKNNTKKRKSEKKSRAAHPELDNGQVDKIEGKAGAKIGSAEPELLFPPDFIKRQMHGKQTDMSAAFESDPSPTPGPRIHHEDDISVYKDDNDAADEDEDDLLDGLDSECEHLAKRRRSSTLERKLGRADLTFRPFANNQIWPAPQNILKESVSASTGALPGPGVLAPQIWSTTPSGQNPAVGGSVATLIPPSHATAAALTPSDTQSISRTAVNMSSPNGSARNIMPSIEQDDDNDENNDGG